MVCTLADNVFNRKWLGNNLTVLVVCCHWFIGIWYN